MTRSTRWRAGASSLLTIAALAIASMAGPASALEEGKDERELLKTCEKNICSMIVGKQATGSDLSCKLAKTWAKDKIKSGVEQHSLSWSFGDARCEVSVNAKRADIVNSVSKPDHALQFEPHTVNCQVERGTELTKINITMAPKITFKSGKAQKAWLNVSTIEAPAIVKGAIWTATQLEDNFGLFHGAMISEINEFIGQKCPKAVAAKE